MYSAFVWYKNQVWVAVDGNGGIKINRLSITKSKPVFGCVGWG